MKHGRPKRVHAAEGGHHEPSARTRTSATRHGERPRGPFIVGVLVLVGAAMVVGGLTGRFRLGGSEPTAIVTVSPRPSASPSPPVSPSPSPSLSPTPSVTPSATPSASPSARPSATPSVTPTPSTARGTLVLQAGGDVSLDPAFLPIFRDKGFAWAWSGLGSVFRQDDLSIVNLECPATSVVAPASRSPVFRCAPEALDSMRAAGIDVANQANEHVSDQGTEGLLDSLRRLRGEGIAPVGAGQNASSAIAPAVFTRDGWKVAVIGVGQVTAQAAGTSTAGTAGKDLASVLTAIRAAAKVADIVVVTIHWGVDGATQPRPEQIEQAEQMVAAGADVIVGHHSHRLQPLRTIDGVPVFFSLGNLVWGAFADGSTTTGIARVTIAPNGSVEASIVPVRIVSSGHPVLV